MSSVMKTLFMVISVVQFVAGIFGNGFIVLINSMDWLKNRKISLVDFILTCLAISRICYLWTTISVITLNTCFENEVYSRNLMIIFDVFWVGSIYFCMACTTCLSVLYFFKIATFSHPVFLWMRWRTHKVLLLIVLGTVFSFCISFTLKEMKTDSLIQEFTKVEKNLTLNFREIVHNFLMSWIPLHVVLVIYFVVSLVSFLLLILSLWCHTRRMKLQGMYSRDLSTEAHVRAMKAMIFFLFFLIVYYFSTVMIILVYTILDSIVAKIFVYVLLFLSPSGHPFLLILWNNKLKQASLCVLRRRSMSERR